MTSDDQETTQELERQWVRRESELDWLYFAVAAVCGGIVLLVIIACLYKGN